MNPLIYVGIGDVVKPDNTLFLDSVMKAVCLGHGVDKKDVLSPLRRKDVAMARHCFCEIARRKSSLTLETIGKHINRHHSTVLNSICKHRELMIYKDYAFLYSRSCDYLVGASCVSSIPQEPRKSQEKVGLEFYGRLVAATSSFSGISESHLLNTVALLKRGGDEDSRRYAKIIRYLLKKELKSPLLCSKVSGATSDAIRYSYTDIKESIPFDGSLRFDVSKISFGL